MALAAGWGGTGLEPEPPESPELLLRAVNPCIGTVVILYSTGSGGSAALDVFDLDGRHLERLDLDPADDPVQIHAGEGLPAGVYFLRLECGHSTSCETAVVLP
ncbi:T9SS type A sorting domain-containing protein [Candidatus Fermentibacteria bacterium]|nr:T9SS type A sorting domain-containing protein [Candidatus Fermentibacteria bacterium]